jgi:hypothetical protein
MLELFPSGEVFGFDLKKYIDKIDGQQIKKIDIINQDLIADDF